MPTVDEVKAAVSGKKPEPPKAERKPEPKAERKAAEPPGPPRKYRVELKDNPPMVVEATDRLGAVDAYKAACGIISTTHEFRVEDAG